MKMILFILGAVMAVAVQAADLFPDDHGDAISEATSMMVPTNGVTVSGRIEIDTDQDWFEFIALPDTVYRLQAQVSSLWDMELEFRGPHTTRLVRATSSALSSAPAKVTLTWTNIGAAGPYYVGIRGYLSFTTGTYSLAVAPLNLIDEDGDSLPDSWEWAQFGWLGSTPQGDDDGDGFSNLSEFYSRTSPTNPASALLLHPHKTAPGVVTVDWPVVPDSVYRVWWSTNLVTGIWMPLDTLYQPVNGGTNLQWNDAFSVSQQFYKVELFLGP
jgi:hypothetical protein